MWVWLTHVLKILPNFCFQPLFPSKSHSRNVRRGHQVSIRRERVQVSCLESAIVPNSRYCGKFLLLWLLLLGAWHWIMDWRCYWYRNTTWLINLMVRFVNVFCDQYSVDLHVKYITIILHDIYISNVTNALYRLAMQWYMWVCVCVCNK